MDGLKLEFLHCFLPAHPFCCVFYSCYCPLLNQRKYRKPNCDNFFVNHISSIAAVQFMDKALAWISQGAWAAHLLPVAHINRLEQWHCLCEQCSSHAVCLVPHIEIQDLTYFLWIIASSSLLILIMSKDDGQAGSRNAACVDKPVQAAADQQHTRFLCGPCVYYYYYWKSKLKKKWIC